MSTPPPLRAGLLHPQAAAYAHYPLRRSSIVRVHRMVFFFRFIPKKLKTRYAPALTLHSIRSQDAKEP